jgi:hypothetical protein
MKVAIIVHTDLDQASVYFWLAEAASVAKFGEQMRFEAVDFEEVPFADLPIPADYVGTATDRKFSVSEAHYSNVTDGEEGEQHD